MAVEGHYFSATYTPYNSEQYQQLGAGRLAVVGAAGSCGSGVEMMAGWGGDAQDDVEALESWSVETLRSM